MSTATATGKIIYQLKEPIQYGSETITQFELRKPKAKEFRRLPAEPDTDDFLKMLGQLAAQTDPVIDELGIEDTMELLELIASFIPGGRKTGKKSLAR